MVSKDYYISECCGRLFGKEERFFLMGIAILWIFFFHIYCWYKGGLPWWIYFFSEGQIGVDMFLFLSAYGLEASLSRNNLWIFYKNRAKRILPVYSLFLCIIFVFFIKGISFSSIILQCVTHITGISLFQTPDFFPTNFEFDWFTPAIILFYVLYPLISKIAFYISSKSINIEIIFLFALCSIGLFSLRFIHLPIYAFLYRIPIFFLGSLTFIHINKNEYKQILILYFSFLIFGLLSNQHWFLSSSIVPSLFLLYSLIQGNRPFHKTIAIIGRHSYEIYLAHIIPITNFFMLKNCDNIYIYIIIAILWTLVLTLLLVFFKKIITQIKKY